MSSMFKKRGGLAFKPKLPTARPRPTAPAPAPGSAPPSQPPKPAAAAEAQITTPPPSDVPSASLHGADTAQPEQPEQPEVLEAASPAIPDSSLEVAQQPAVDSTSIATPAIPTIQEPPPQQASESDDQSLTAEELAAPPATNLPRQQSSETLAPSLAPVGHHRRPQPATAPVAPSIALPDPGEASPAEAAITPEAGQPPEAPQPTPPPSNPRRKRPAAAAAAATATGEASDSSAAPAPKKRQRRTAQNGGTETGEAPARKPRRTRAAAAADGEARTRTPRRARSLTPEDAENQVVDLQKLTMSDLTRDLHIGKKFSRHDELRDRERQARLKGKLRTESEGPEGGEKAENGGSASSASAGAATPSTAAPPAAPSSQTTGAGAGGGSAAAGPQFRIVDGQIVLDQSSLVMDRHARAVATQGDMEVVEENDFTRLITSSSFMNTSKLKGPNIWTAPETELFYRGLAMFGTDFEMISQMFPGKQRRHVKLKFNREERHCPKLIDAALIGEKKTKMDLNEYKAFTGTVFESVESIEAEQRKIQEDFEAEQQRIADEQAEVMRKKREELFADDDGDKAADDAGGKKKKKRKTKQQHEDEGRYGVIEEVA